MARPRTMDAYIEAEDSRNLKGQVCLWYSDIGQRIPELRQLLLQLAYPRSVTTLLAWLDSYFEQCENFPPGRFPNQEHVKTLIQEFIFSRSQEKNFQPMTPMQELQILEELCCYIQDNLKLPTIHNIFDGLFGNCGHPLEEMDEVRHKALRLLVSMAISIRCPAVLECAAVWMYSQDCSAHSISLSHTLMSDFCELLPAGRRILATVPEMSPRFAFHLLTALLSHYNTYQSTSHPIKLIPPSQLEVISDWLNDQPTVVLHPVDVSKLPSGRVPPFYLHPSHKSAHDPSLPGPVPGLLWQSVLSPLILDANRASIQEGLGARQCSLHDYSLLFSKLHLGILQSFVAAAGSATPTPSKPPLRRGALTLSDIESVVMLTVHTIHDNSIDEEAIRTAVERIAQIIQVALATGMINTTKDKIIPLCKELPSSDLLTLILHGKLPS